MAGVTYDVLDNERRKAVCELRRIVDEDKPVTMRELADAIGMNLSIGDRVSTPTCMRLIHLLGGDQTSGIDVLREMDEREAEGRITDELRELIDDNWPTEIDDARILREKDGSVPCSLLLIADRIDARHYLTRAVAEASTSDEWIAMSEYDKLRRQRDELRTELDMCYRHASVEDVVRGITLGTYSMTEGIERLERIYGSD